MLWPPRKEERLPPQAGLGSLGEYGHSLPTGERKHIHELDIIKRLYNRYFRGGQPDISSPRGKNIHDKAFLKGLWNEIWMKFLVLELTFFVQEHITTHHQV